MAAMFAKFAIFQFFHKKILIQIQTYFNNWREKILKTTGIVDKINKGDNKEYE